MYVGEGVHFGGLLRGGAPGCGADFFTPTRAGAAISRINIADRCDVCGARGAPYSRRHRFNMGNTTASKGDEKSKYGPTPRRSRAVCAAAEGHSEKRTTLGDRESIGLTYRMSFMVVRVPRATLEPLS